MIVYPAGLPAALLNGATPLWLPRICYQNALRDLDINSVTASTTAQQAPRDAPLRPNTIEFWQPTELPATYEVDLGEDFTIDYVGLIHNLGASKTCQVLVETSPVSTEWTTFSQAHTPQDSSPTLFLDAADTNVRKIRFTFTGGSVMPRLAVTYAGQALVMPMGVQIGHRPITLSRETIMHQPISRGGEFMGEAMRRLGVHTMASFRGLSETWYRTFFEPFAKIARKYPFFWAWRADPFVNEVAYVKCARDIVPSYHTEFLMGVDIEMYGKGTDE